MKPELKVYRAERPHAVFIVAHGAGGGQMTPFMVRAAQGLAERGVTAVTFDFPYMAARRKVPDRAPVLEGCWRDAIAGTREWAGSLPLYIGGKSMGGRMASHVAAQGCDGLHGVIYLGYPLHPPGKPDYPRDKHLPAVREPMLFVQGSRDDFGTADEIRALLPRLQRAELHEIAGGDHSFKTRGRTDALPEALDVVAAWIARMAGANAL